MTYVTKGQRAHKAMEEKIPRRTEQILTGDVDAVGQRLPPDEAVVTGLMASIQEIGLLQPIIVWKPTARTMRPKLVTGFNRLEACRRLKHPTISARAS